MNGKLITLLASLGLVFTCGLSSCTGPVGPTGPQGTVGPQGETGEDGKDGKDGVSVTSISKTSSNGLVDTYTIYYSDGSTSSFNVTNGEGGKDGLDGIDGEQGIQGEPGKDGHTPVITIGDDGYCYVDGAKTDSMARGPKGDKGDQGEPGKDGLSAYDLFKKYNPDYPGTEKEWVDDLANNNLKKVKVSFVTNCDIQIDSINVWRGRCLSEDLPILENNNKVLIGWFNEGIEIDIDTYKFFEDTTLITNWGDLVTLTLDLNGGKCETTTLDVITGDSYQLPIPTKEDSTFVKWTLEGKEIPLSGLDWNYSYVNCTLVANYKTTHYNVTLSCPSLLGSIDVNQVKIPADGDFSLPIPTLTDASDIFIGWFDGDKQITDDKGNSIVKLSKPISLLTAKIIANDKNIYISNSMNKPSLENNQFEVASSDETMFTFESTNATNYDNGVLSLPSGASLKNIDAINGMVALSITFSGTGRLWLGS